jgi:hypothetical protein
MDGRGWEGSLWVRIRWHAYKGLERDLRFRIKQSTPRIARGWVWEINE